MQQMVVFMQNIFKIVLSNLLYFDTYSQASGENAKSTGRKRNPLLAWSGDLDKVDVRNECGLNEFLEIEDKDTNNYYVQ